MDQQLLFLINREWTSPVLDWLMAAVSSFGAWALPIGLLGAILLWKGDFRVRACVLTAGAIVGINDGLITNPVKHHIDRPRPSQVIDGVRVVRLPPKQPARAFALSPGRRAAFARRVQGRWTAARFLPRTP